MLLLGAIAVLGAITCFIVIAVFFGPRHEIHQRLAELELSDGVEKRESEDVLQRLLAADQRSALERRLHEAAWDVSVRQMIVRCAIGGAIGLALGVAFAFFWGSLDMISLGAGAVVTLAAAYAPMYQLNVAAEKRKKTIHRELPDFLDIISTTVEAGIALNGAFSVAVDSLKGPLGDELRIALSDIRLGRSRVEALAAMAKRIHEPDITATITAMVQAEKLGGNVAVVLADLAHEARDKRIMRAEELAAQLPVKMTFPMVVCMLPALFLMIFGSVAADYLSK